MQTENKAVAKRLNSKQYNYNYKRAYRFARINRLQDDVSFAYRYADNGGGNLETAKTEWLKLALDIRLKNS